MEAQNLSGWVEKLKSSGDVRERRIIIEKIEPLLNGLVQAEKDVLFPALSRLLGFAEWMQEARAHHSSFRELIQFARRTTDPQHIFDISNELCERVLRYLDGMQKIVYPRLIQALKRSELKELRARLGRYWLFHEISRDCTEAAA